MRWKDGCTTNPLLLKRVADWADHPAWFDFFSNYDPLIRFWCRGYGLDDDTLEDFCQQVWIELAGRIRTYQYDPGRTFRGWLRRLCHSRAIDLIRKRKTEFVRFHADQPADEQVLLAESGGGDELDELESRRSLLLHHVEQVQQTVKQRVDPNSWQAFWRIAVDGCSVREAANNMGMSYAAVFAAYKRVGRMLRAEGQRLLAQRSPGGPADHVRELS